MSEPHVSKLSSGYWHVRWSDNLWLQWPIGRAPTAEDGFGWITQSHVNQAIEQTAKENDDAED